MGANPSTTIWVFQISGSLHSLRDLTRVLSNEGYFEINKGYFEILKKINIVNKVMYEERLK